MPGESSLSNVFGNLKVLCPTFKLLHVVPRSLGTPLRLLGCNICKSISHVFPRRKRQSRSIWFWQERTTNRWMTSSSSEFSYCRRKTFSYRKGNCSSICVAMRSHRRSFCIQCCNVLITAQFAHSILAQSLSQKGRVVLSSFVRPKCLKCYYTQWKINNCLQRMKFKNVWNLQMVQKECEQIMILLTCRGKYDVWKRPKCWKCYYTWWKIYNFQQRMTSKN